MAKILIIEDDTNINNMVSEYLTGSGYLCTQAFSGSEGALRFSMEEFDLILLDLMLPGMTGEELIRTFAGKVPVIVLSAKNELDSKVELLTAGANDYICKPFDLKELLVRVQVQLRSLPASKLPDAQMELHYKDWILDPETQEMTAAGLPVELTLHEASQESIYKTAYIRVCLGGGLFCGGQDHQCPYQQYPLKAKTQSDRFIHTDCMGDGL